MLRKYTRPLCKSLSRQAQREEHFRALARPDQDFGGPVKAMQRKCTRPVFKSLFGRAQRGGHLEHWPGKTRISDALSKLYWKTKQDPIQEDLLRKTAVPKAQLQMTNPNTHHRIIDFRTKHKPIQEDSLRNEAGPSAQLQMTNSRTHHKNHQLSN